MSVLSASLEGAADALGIERGDINRLLLFV